MISTIEQRELDFRAKVNLMIAFPYSMRKEFVEYWTEPNKAGTKMLFEMEKTWDLSRRLNRWASNDFGKKNHGVIKEAVKEPETPVEPMISELDTLLGQYSKHPTTVPFTDFGKYFDYLKKEHLLKPFNSLDIQNIRAAYGDDNYKCRCACVQMTFDGYTNKGITFGQIWKVRKSLEPVK